MTYEKIDEIFPYVVFAYGILVTFVLSSDGLVRLANERFPKQLHEQLFAHRGFALLCLCIGALWILQMLWLGP